MIYSNLSITRDPDDFCEKLFLNERYLGEHDPETKTFRTTRNNVFRKYNGFGINKEILTDDRLDIEKIEVEYSGVIYSAAAELFLSSEFRFEFRNIVPHDVKYFVPIQDFKIKKAVNN